VTAMLNPGIYALAVREITAALTASAQSAISDLEGVSAVTLEAAFAYGSGGTSCAVTVQTSFDGGTTWRDVARFDFTTASAVKHANLSARGEKGVTAYAALGSEGVTQGLLGERLRAVITSVGTYANTLLSVRAAVR